MNKQRNRKRLLSSLLCLSLVLSGLTVPAGKVQAEEVQAKTTKMLGTDAIVDPTAPDENVAWTGSYVYFGTYNGSNVKYRVLDSNTTVYGGTTMLLDCDSVLWAGSDPSSAFDVDSNVWADSDIRTYLN